MRKPWLFVKSYKNYKFVSGQRFFFHAPVLCLMFYALSEAIQMKSNWETIQYVQSFPKKHISNTSSAFSSHFNYYSSTYAFVKFRPAQSRCETQQFSKTYMLPFNPSINRSDNIENICLLVFFHWMWA